MDIVMIAGLKNGRSIYEFLKTKEDINLLAVFVLKDQYINKVSDFVAFDDIVDKDRLIKVDCINDHEKLIAELHPDYIIVVGWSQLISEGIIKSAKNSCIGFHPSQLPEDRGRSVLAWQMVEGYTRGCVSMFEIDTGVDSGRIIGQIEYSIEYEDTIREVLEKAYKCCLYLTEKYIFPYMEGKIIPIEQDEAKATYRRLRKFDDGLIDWNKNSQEIYNLVRAITIPYPVAITFLNGLEIRIVEAYEIECDKQFLTEPCGKIIHADNLGVAVKTGNGAILIKKIKIGNDIIDENRIKDFITLNDSFSTR